MRSCTVFVLDTNVETVRVRCELVDQVVGHVHQLDVRKWTFQPLKILTLVDATKRIFYEMAKQELVQLKLGLFFFSREKLYLRAVSR